MRGVLVLQTYREQNDAAYLAAIQRLPRNVLPGAANGQRGLSDGGRFAMWDSDMVFEAGRSLGLA